jgi:hypothetical protein
VIRLQVRCERRASLRRHVERLDVVTRLEGWRAASRSAEVREEHSGGAVALFTAVGW